MTFEDFKEQADRFREELHTRMAAQKISLLPHWNIDHLCYRVESGDRYSDLKNQISKFATLLIESPVNGRMISTFKLRSPVFFGEHRIDLVELPAPKLGKAVREGFEHIEIVTDLSMDEIRTRFGGARFNEGGLKRDFNSELEMQLGDWAIKFHQLSLESVVTLEGNSRVFSAITESRILESCRDFSPLIVGTFPLGLQGPESDVDVLLSSPDLDALLERLVSLFFSCAEFESEKSWGSNGNDGKDFVITRFKWNGVPFEVYGEKTPTHRQRAYLHFQVEERLLKLGGRPLRERVRALRESGMKTEPAFASALGLKGDPYFRLLELHRSSEEELASLVMA